MEIYDRDTMLFLQKEGLEPSSEYVKDGNTIYIFKDTQELQTALTIYMIVSGPKSHDVEINDAETNAYIAYCHVKPKKEYINECGYFTRVYEDTKIFRKALSDTYRNNITLTSSLYTHYLFELEDKEMIAKRKEIRM